VASAACVFERAPKVRGDPTAVEVTGLGLDEFVVDPAFDPVLCEAAGVEGHMSGDGGVGS